MAGLLGFNGLGLDGINGLLGGPQQGTTVAQLLNPAAMRKYQIKRGLVNAGIAMMNPDPHAPPRNFGQILGQSLAGGFQGAEQAKQDYLQDGMFSLQLQDMQRQEDEQAQQKAALDAFMASPDFAALPPNVQSYMKIYPAEALKSWMGAQMAGGEGYTLSPGQTRFGPGNQPVASLPGNPGGEWREVTLEDGVYAVNTADPRQKYKIGERANRNEGEGRDFSQSRGLRQDYVKQAKPFEDLRTMYQRMIASYEGAQNDQTGASDIAMVFSYMKMLDPTSVVREGEQATAQNAAGVPDTIRTMWNRLLSGERLPQSVRDAFLDQAGLQYEQQLGSYNQTRSQFQEFARKRNLDPFEVAPDLTYGVTPYQRKQSIKNKYQGLE